MKGDRHRHAEARRARPAGQGHRPRAARPRLPASARCAPARSSNSNLAETDPAGRPRAGRGDGAQAARQHRDRKLPGGDQPECAPASLSSPASTASATWRSRWTAARGAKPRMIWHRETDLSGLDLVVIPGGFSYGDYLRCGAMAAQIAGHARGARPCRARRLRARRLQRLPDPDRGRAAARRAAAQRRRCASSPWTAMLRVERSDTVFTAALPEGRDVPRADGAWRRQLLRRRRDARPAGGRGPGRLPLRAERGADAPTATAPPATSPASIRPICACSA